jgi:hypothetical protein
MDPGKALATGEQALRQLLAIVLPTALGSDWLDKVAKPDQLEKWRARRADEAAKRGPKGVASLPQDDLSYAQLWELVQIAEKNWSHLSPALGKLKDTGALLRRMEDLRNTVGHSRELLPFEADLLSGIAGELRNRVTIYMTQQDPSGDHYPRIESVTDQYGNSTTQFQRGLSVRTGLVLPFGSTVRFQCRATDPQGREITLDIRTNGKWISVVGDDIEVDWTFDMPGEVGERTALIFIIRSSSEYHRTNGMDDYYEFQYSVTPPRA